MIRSIFYCALTGLLFFATQPQVKAQAERNAASQSRQPSDQADSTARQGADETFELNIVERRITVPGGYSAATAVELGQNDGRGVNLRVGVFLTANQIDVLLRNVIGRVRFRATLEPILRRVRSHRTVTTSQ